MPRRRKKNPLLMRILVISVVAHIIILPVAAHFGAFDKMKKEFGTSRVVMVTVPPDDPKKPPAKETKKAHKTQSASKKAPSASSKATSAAKSSNLPQPKVVAAAGGGDGEGGGATVDPNGTGKAGQLPTNPTPPGGGGGTPVTPPDKPVETLTPPNPTPPKPEPPKPAAPAEAPKPEAPKPAEPKPKKFVQIETVSAPEPQIPDDLRGEPFEKTLVVEADVDTEGKPMDVKIVESTGTKELDDIGLDTARKYRFKPATLDDTPVAGHVRFRIVFKVE